jgi:hypothetical protein
MDQINKVREDDPMAKSWENNDMVMRAEFANISRMLIGAGITSLSKAIETIEINFKGDEAFYQLFPIIFNIELRKAKNKGI